MTYFNNLGQARVGWRIPSGEVTPSTLWTSVYGVWNADTLGTSLDTSIYGVYNGDNVNDTSGNALNGTNVNNVTFTTGKIGNAFTFNGSSNYVALPNDSFNFAGNFSISGWINLNSVSGNQCIFSNLSYVSNISNGWLLLMRNNRLNIEFYKNNGTFGGLQSLSTLNTSTWYHITVVRVASTSTKIYINGVLDRSDTSAFNPTYTSTIPIPSSIGAWKYDATTATQFTNGKIDGLTIWNRELTEAEITSLYNTGTGAEYPFSSQTLPSPNDAVSTNHGTLMNGCTFATGKIGQAFTFDGINDYVALPDNALNFTGKFSYSFWSKSNDTTNYGVVVGNMQSSRSPFGFFHGYEISFDLGKYFFYFRSGTNIQFIHYTTNVVNNGNWNHIVVTYDPNNSTTGAKIYVNGTLNIQSNTLGLGSPIGYSSPMKACIGARNHSGAPVNFLPNGTSIDALSSWNKELTATEVTELYNAGAGKQYPN